MVRTWFIVNKGAGWQVTKLWFSFRKTLYYGSFLKLVAAAIGIVPGNVEKLALQINQVASINAYVVSTRNTEIDLTWVAVVVLGWIQKITNNSR